MNVEYALRNYFVADNFKLANLPYKLGPSIIAERNQSDDIEQICGFLKGETNLHLRKPSTFLFDSFGDYRTKTLQKVVELVDTFSEELAQYDAEGSMIEYTDKPIFAKKDDSEYVCE